MSDRPAVVTLLRGLYLWNRKPDWQAVFFGGYPHSFCRVWGPIPNHASTHCGTWRVLPGGMSQMFRLLFLGNGWADCIEIWVSSWGPISYSLCSNHGWGISARAHVQRYPPHRASVSRERLGRLCSNLVCGLGVTKYVLSTSQGWGGASLHVRTCTPISVSQDPSGQLC